MKKKDLKLTAEEKDLLESFERGEWKSVPNLEEEKKRYQAYARASLQKKKRVNIRISDEVLIKLQQKALREGIPYQTLMSSILHKYVNGSLIER